jgi:uncharacterized protein YkwD
MGVRSRFAAVAVAQLILLCVCTSASASAACPGDGLQPTLGTMSDSAQALVCDINDFRADNGLAPLRWNSRLATGAQGHADDMAARHYFAHVNPEGRDVVARIRPTGYIPSDAEWSLAENLGFGTSSLATPTAIVAGWVDSAPHSQNMLDPGMEDVGVGIAQGTMSGDAQPGMFYVTDFGARGSTAAGTASRAHRSTRAKRKSLRCTRKVRVHGRRARCARRR